MALIRVSANELRARAEQLNEMNNTLKAKIEEFSASSDALAAQWEGEARDAFANACTQDKAQMDNFVQVIQQFYQALIAMAQAYENAESKNLEIASTRTYG